MQPKDLIAEIARKCLTKSNLTLERADDIVTKAMHNGLTLYYYKCNVCSSYHLTSKCPTFHRERIKVV